MSEIVEDEREEHGKRQEHQWKRHGETKCAVRKNEESAEEKLRKRGQRRKTRATTVRAPAKREVGNNRHEREWSKWRVTGITTRAAREETLTRIDARNDNPDEARED